MKEADLAGSTVVYKMFRKHKLFSSFKNKLILVYSVLSGLSVQIGRAWHVIFNVLEAQ